MAIPRDTNAVFYHPLDTRNESVSGASWDGTAKFSPGRVALALTASETPAFGAETQFSAVRVLSEPPAMAALGGGRAHVRVRRPRVLGGGQLRRRGSISPQDD